MSESENLIVHSRESFGVFDGPGIRLVVFLQGCNMQCKYCHNPDTIARKGGTATQLSDLLTQAKHMKPFFGDTGGVTVSGGEPLLQSKAIIPFFEALKAEGIHTNIDTNGIAQTPETQYLISTLADLVMFDIKGTNDLEFKTITGCIGFEHLMSNINLREKSEKPYWLRYVLVPGYTDSEASLNRVIEIFSGLKHLEKLEILPYHKQGISKWKSMQLKYELEDVAENTDEQIDRVFKMLNPHFKNLCIKK